MFKEVEPSTTLGSLLKGHRVRFDPIGIVSRDNLIPDNALRIYSIFLAKELSHRSIIPSI